MMQESLPTIRLNPRAAIGLAVGIALSAIVAIVIHFGQSARVRTVALKTIRSQIDEGKVDLAVRNLDALLRTYPDDFEALEINAKLLAASAQTIEQLLNAAIVNDRFVRVNPDSPGAQDARRRTVQLYILFGDLYQESTYYRAIPEVTVFNVRDRAAVAIAKELIDRGAHDVGDYVLLAQAEERLAQGQDSETVDDAIRDYRRALRIDPTHLVASERLANLLAVRKGEKMAALGVLDRLTKARPDSPELRLVRHRFFRNIGDEARASAELDAALRLAPDNLAASLEAAELAVRRGRTKEARRFASMIPDRYRNDFRVRLILGLIELQENHPDTALEIWRKGLVTSQGTDVMLTWNLAFSLLQLGRFVEAQPLIDQYRRLIGDNTSPMLNLLLAIKEQKSGHSLKAARLLAGLRDQIDPRWKQLVDYTLGESYQVSGQRDLSLMAYRRVLDENPRAVAVRINLAEGLISTRPREATEIIDVGLKSNPDDAPLCLARAAALLQVQEELPKTSRNWEEFDLAMKKAVAVAPNHSKLALIRVRRKLLEGKTDEAITVLEEAIRRDPRKPKLWESYVETLVNAGRATDGLIALQRASAPEAIGDTVGIRLARFRVLENLSRAQEAREQLVKDLDRFSLDHRASIWAALGSDLVSRGELSSALRLYSEWAKQIPEDTRPRMALLEIAINGTEENSREASSTLRSLGNSEDVAVRLDHARELIRVKSRDETELREASQILESVRIEFQELAALDALQGEFSEHRGMIREAASAYRRAWDGGSEGSLKRLVDLLARENPVELERLSTTIGSPQIVRMAVQTFLLLGQTDRAIRIVSVTPATKESAEMTAWRVDLLERLGKTNQSEVLFRAEVTRRPGAPHPWMTLLRFQSKHRDPATVAATLLEAKSSLKEERTDFTEARLAWAVGNLEEADRAFRACLSAGPDDVEVLLAVSEFAQETGRPSEAEGYLRRILALKPGDRKTARRLALQLVDRPFDQAGWERAWAVLGPEKIAIEDPEDRLVRAILLTKGAGPEFRRRAIVLLEALVADLPADTPSASKARGLLAKLFLDSGKPDRTVRLLGPRVEHTAGSDASEVALYAEALIQIGQYDLATSQLDRLAKRDSSDERLARLRARLIDARAVPGEAAEDLERAYLAMREPLSAKAFGREAFALMAVAKPPMDEVADRLARALAVKDPELSWMPAMIAGRNGRPADALRLCREAVRVADPFNARESCRVAVGVAFGDPQVDHRAELDAILEAASQRDPNGTEITLEIAQLRHRQGRYGEAVQLYRTVIDRRPDLRPSIQNNVAWILSEDLKRPEEAIKVVDDLIQSQGRTAPILDTRGVILTRLGRTTEAIKDLEDSNRNVANPVHLFHLARAYRVAGRIEEFQRCRNLVVRSGLTSAMVEPSERAELTALMRP